MLVRGQRAFAPSPTRRRRRRRRRRRDAFVKGRTGKQSRRGVRVVLLSCRALLVAFDAFVHVSVRGRRRASRDGARRSRVLLQTRHELVFSPSIVQTARRARRSELGDAHLTKPAAGRGRRRGRARVRNRRGGREARPSPRRGARKPPLSRRGVRPRREGRTGGRARKHRAARLGRPHEPARDPARAEDRPRERARALRRVVTHRRDAHTAATALSS